MRVTSPSGECLTVNGRANDSCGAARADRFKAPLGYCNTGLSGVARAIEIRAYDRTGGPAMSKVLSV